MMLIVPYAFHDDMEPISLMLKSLLEIDNKSMQFMGFVRRDILVKPLTNSLLLPNSQPSQVMRVSGTVLMVSMTEAQFEVHFRTKFEGLETLDKIQIGISQ